ncbi:MAG: 50S ribosomal protein L5 [Firmicutes bacterium]|nr:50S ribosomal protein L5 [Bacillota bacterium]
MSRLKVYYKTEIVYKLMKKFSFENVMAVPKIEKVVINMGAGEVRENSKVINHIMFDLSVITGQRPVSCVAKKAISNFKIREGMKIGAKVTLRGNRMYEFIDRLFNLALPRVRDFRGISKDSFDGFGNYNLGIKEQLIFSEIDYDKIDKIRGMDIAIVTTTRNDDYAYELLRCFGAPFKNVI